MVRHVVLPHFEPFGWAVFVVEACLAAFLILGLATRFWAVVGALQAAAIGLSVALSPGEWPWTYYLMVAANLVLFATAAGRVWGLDAIVRPILVGRDDRLGRLIRRVT